MMQGKDTNNKRYMTWMQFVGISVIYLSLTYAGMFAITTTLVEYVREDIKEIKIELRLLRANK